MLRLFFIASLGALAACGAAGQPVHSPSAQPQLFRGGQSEVRLRCGSESLRARLRQDRLLVQVGAGESAELVPVNDPRAKAGSAYGDGKLTLYKLRDAETWALARSDSSTPAPCRPDQPAH